MFFSFAFMAEIKVGTTFVRFSAPSTFAASSRTVSEASDRPCFAIAADAAYITGAIIPVDGGLGMGTD